MVFLDLKLQENRKKTGRKPKENQKKTKRKPKENQKKTKRKPKKTEENQKKRKPPPLLVTSVRVQLGLSVELGFVLCRWISFFMF